MNYPFFSFSVSPEDGDGLFRRIVFKGGGEFNAKTFAYYITEIVNAAAIDTLEMVVPEFELDSIKSSVEGEGLIRNALQRRPSLVACLHGFDSKGNLGKSFYITERKDIQPLQKDRIIRLGIWRIAEANKNKGVLHCAPEGCVFEKPSGERHLYYLRGGALLGSDSQCGFLAFSLLDMIDEGKIKCIALDTMAIAPLAYKLIVLKNGFDSVNWNPEVYSFHSYAGFKGTDASRNALADSGRTFILVSASSSGNMPKEIRKYWNVPESQICTLLTFDENDGESFTGRVLHKVETPEKRLLDYLTPVKIAGEFFVPQQRKVKQFLLRAKHAPKGLKDAMNYLYQADVFKIKVESGLWVDAGQLAEEGCIKNWLKEATKRRAPASTSHVVYVDDASKKMAGEVKGQLSAYGIEVDLVGLDGLCKKVENVRSVVVVSAVARSGEKLLDVSCRLRNLLSEGCSIAYFVGLYIPESNEKKEKFLSSLTYSPARSFKYTFDCWNCFPIGKSNSGMWSREIDVLRRYEAFEESSRWNVISKDVFEDVFWGSLTEQELRIRSDFAFWAPNFNREKAKGSAVYFTVLAVLQKARDEHGFYSSEYEGVVLDPDCFARFNDGVIQASLLRGCEPAELNYRGAKEASAFMRDLIIGMIRREPSEANEALPEFLLALRLEKMSLEKGDLKEVKTALQKSACSEEIKLLLKDSQ